VPQASSCVCSRCVPCSAVLVTLMMYMYKCCSLHGMVFIAGRVGDSLTVEDRLVKRSNHLHGATSLNEPGILVCLNAGILALTNQIFVSE